METKLGESTKLIRFPCIMLPKRIQSAWHMSFLEKRSLRRPGEVSCQVSHHTKSPTTQSNSRHVACYSAFLSCRRTLACEHISRMNFHNQSGLRFQRRTFPPLNFRLLISGSPECNCQLLFVCITGYKRREFMD